MNQKTNNGTSTGTIVRTVVLILALVNQGLIMAGYSTLPFTSEGVEDALTTAFTALASLSAWWKNNSFTEEAKSADSIMKDMKRDRKKRGQRNE